MGALSQVLAGSGSQVFTRFIIATHSNSPYLSAYPWISGQGFGPKYANPTGISLGTGSIGLAYNDTAIVCGALSSSYLAATKFGSYGFNSPYTPPGAGAGVGPNTPVIAIDFSPDNAYVGLISQTGGAGTFWFYAWSNSTGFGTCYQQSSPSGIGALNCFKFNPAGTYVVIGSQSSPYVNAWPFSAGNVGSKVANPATLPTANCRSMKFSPNGAYVFATIDASPYIYAYNFSSGFGAKVADPATLPTGTSYTVDITSAGDYVLIGMATSPYLHVYPWSGTFGTKVTNPGTLPPSGGRAAFNNDGTAIVIGQDSASPYIGGYPFTSGAYGTKYADPQSVLAGSIRDLVFK